MKWSRFRCRDYTLAGQYLPTTSNPNDPILSLQAPINIGDPTESNVLLAQVSCPVLNKSAHCCTFARSLVALGCIFLCLYPSFLVESLLCDALLCFLDSIPASLASPCEVACMHFTSMYSWKT